MPPVELATAIILAGSFGEYFVFAVLVTILWYVKRFYGRDIFHYNMYYIIMNTYIETLDEIQKIEEVITRDSKLKQCCNSSLAIVEILLNDLNKSRTL